MSLVIEYTNSRDFKPVPAGTHLAVCVMVVDLGVQNDSKYKPRAKLYVRWEIPGVIVSWHDRNGNERTGPAVIGKYYTKSLAPKSNLRTDLESWRGRSLTDDELRSFDVTAILGKPCQLGIVHVDGGDRIRANIAAVMGAPKGVAPKPSGKLIAFDVDRWVQVAFEALPEWLQERINERIITSTAPPRPMGNGSITVTAEAPFADNATPF
jgi:hypothetical protein